MASSSLKLKCHCIISGQADTHLIILTAGTTFSELRAKLSKSFGFAIEYFKWQDNDGDLVTVAGDADVEALLAAGVSTVTAYVGSRQHELGPVRMRGGLSDGSHGMREPQGLSSMQKTGLQSTARMAIGDSVVQPSSAALNSKTKAFGSDGGIGFGTLGNMGRWQRGQKLGSGAYGTVYKGLMDSGELVAVKQLDTDEVSSRELIALEHELSVLQALNHDNIVRYLGIERSGHMLSIFLEYAPGGSIRQLLDAFGKFDESKIRSYTRQLLLGLEYLHRANIAHRDIKGGNVLLGHDGVIKLADFGQAKRITAKSLSVTGGIEGSHNPVTGAGDIKGTPLFMAPEAVREASMTSGWRKADIWSVGCTVIEMATGRPPWDGFANPLQAMYTIACTDALPRIPDSLSSAGKEFLSCCLKRDPSQRSDVTLLLLHPFVNGSGAGVSASRVSRSGARRPRKNEPQRPSTSYDSREASSSPTPTIGSHSLRNQRAGLRLVSMDEPKAVAGDDVSSVGSLNEFWKKAPLESNVPIQLQSVAYARVADNLVRPSAVEHKADSFASRSVITMDDLPGLSSASPGLGSHPNTQSMEILPLILTSVDESSVGSAGENHLMVAGQSRDDYSTEASGTGEQESPLFLVSRLVKPAGLTILRGGVSQQQSSESLYTTNLSLLPDVDQHIGRIDTDGDASQAAQSGKPRRLRSLRVPNARIVGNPAGLTQHDLVAPTSSHQQDFPQHVERHANLSESSSIFQLSGVLSNFRGGNLTVPEHDDRSGWAASGESYRSLDAVTIGSRTTGRENAAGRQNEAPRSHRSASDQAGTAAVPSQVNEDTSVGPAAGSLAHIERAVANNSLRMTGTSGIPRLKSATKDAGASSGITLRSNPALRSSATSLLPGDADLHSDAGARRQSSLPAAIAYTVISGGADSTLVTTTPQQHVFGRPLQQVATHSGRVPSGAALRMPSFTAVGRVTPLGWSQATETQDRSPDSKRNGTQLWSTVGTASDTELDSVASVGTASVDGREVQAGFVQSGSSPHRLSPRLRRPISGKLAPEYGASIAAPLPVHATLQGHGQYGSMNGRQGDELTTVASSPNRVAMNNSLTLLRNRSGGFRRPRGSASLRGQNIGGNEDVPVDTSGTDGAVVGFPESLGYAAQFAQRRRALASRSAHATTSTSASPTRALGNWSLVGGGDMDHTTDYSGVRTHSNFRSAAPAPASPELPGMLGQRDDRDGAREVGLFSPSHSPLSHQRAAYR